MDCSRLGLAQRALGAWRFPLLLGMFAVLALAGSAPARAYTFGEPGVRAAGPEVRVFDWTTQKCSNDDIPDQATRAFRDATGQVVMVNSHHTTRRWAGPTLYTVAHSCSIMMGSGKNVDPAMYDDREWLSSTWTADGSTVYGLIIDEYQGYNHGPGYCIRSGESWADKAKCWYNSLTLAKSTNNGATFSHATPPDHYLAGPPVRYAVGIGPIGFFQPSNIVRGKDGYLYTLVHVQDYGPQQVGACLLRTNRIDDPSSWRMWDGTGFNRRIRDPYRHDYPPEEGTCVPTGWGTLSESLTWNTYLKKWMLVGAWDGTLGPGFYYFTSDDLINWTTMNLLMNAELPWTWTCSDGPEQVRDPSVLDNDSKSRNFDTVGQRPSIYFKRFNVSNCATSLDRDLIRIPIEFSNQQPGGPSASLSASTLAPTTGERVTFDASGSSDADGSITTYKWDLDGDGLYDRDTGTSPVASAVYSEPDKVTVTVRVCDDDGKGTDETALLNVAGDQVPAQPQNSTVSDKCPGASSGGGGGGTPPSGGSAGGGTPGGATPGVGTQGIGSAAGPAPATVPIQVSTPPLGRFRIVGKPLSRPGGTVVLRVQAPAAGLFTARGRGARAAIRPARANTARAGTITITLRPSKAGKALLRRTNRVKVKAALVFTPIGGAPQKSTRVLTLMRALAR